MTMRSPRQVALLTMGLVAVLLAISLASGCGSWAAPPAGVARITAMPTMVSVPAGTFTMGFGESDTAPMGPAHSVTLTRDYAIGKHEVTCGQYADMLNYALNQGALAGDYAGNVTVMNAEGNSQELVRLNGAFADQPCPVRYRGGLFVADAGKEDWPMMYVTWYGAVFYTVMLSRSEGLSELYDLTDWSPRFIENDTVQFGSPGYRLPTEAEWEYAARYNDGRFYPWGNEDWTESRANYNGSVGAPSPVGSFPDGDSSLGIQDLAGNVSEWVQDFYAPYGSAGARTDPVNNTSGTYRQRRGGGWLPYANNFVYTTYHTDTNYAYVYYPDLGFRVVRAP
ncbi:MAG: SUMF1/EgtB/PvdO family nonheme iron enzyme [Armatimonadia bacterium]|nr:SUMF1/EgtB/PvdO family nonheme iron enzyme [Armatimonadia bacterium]